MIFDHYIFNKPKWDHVLFPGRVVELLQEMFIFSE